MFCVLLLVLDNNHAPLWVFVLLGAAVAIVSLIFHFASYSGSEHDYLYADPSNDYFGSPGSPSVVSLNARYGAFGGFAGFRGGL